MECAGPLMLIILVDDDRAKAKDVGHWLHLSLLDYRPVHVDYMIIFLITDDSFIMYLLDKKGNGLCFSRKKHTSSYRGSQHSTHGVRVSRAHKSASAYPKLCQTLKLKIYFVEKYIAMSFGWHKHFKIKHTKTSSCSLCISKLQMTSFVFLGQNNGSCPCSEECFTFQNPHCQQSSHQVI